MYIRNEGDGHEELFNEREDPRELINLARTDTPSLVLQRFRDRLDRMNAKTPDHAR